MKRALLLALGLATIPLAIWVAAMLEREEQWRVVRRRVVR